MESNITAYIEVKTNEKRTLITFPIFLDPHHRYSNIPLLQSDSVFINFERPNQLEIMPVPTEFIEQIENDQEEARVQAEQALGLISASRPDAYYIDSDEIEIGPVPTNVIPAESIMSTTNEMLRIHIEFNILLFVF